MKPIDVFEKMANLDDDLIDAATLPEPNAAPTRAGGIRHRLAELSDFFNRPAVVAAACVLVTFGVLAGIVGAGQMASHKDAAMSPAGDNRQENVGANLDGTRDECGVTEGAMEGDSNILDGLGSDLGVDPPAEDSPVEDVTEASTDGEGPEYVLPEVEPSVPTVPATVFSDGRSVYLPQYVVGYSGVIETADGLVQGEMDGMGALAQIEAIADELAAVRYTGDLSITLPRTCTIRNWTMLNEDFVVLDASENLDKLADAVALMKGPMEDGESHSVYIVLAVDYKGGQNRGIFEYAFRVMFGEPALDTTPVDPEEDSTIASEGWGEDDPDDLPEEETKVSWDDDKVIVPDETLKMIADNERSVYPYAHLIYAGSRDEDTGKWVSESMPTFERWAPESMPDYMNELPVLTWAGYELKLALRFEDRMKVNNLRAYHTDLTYIDTVYDAADLKILPTGRYIVIAEVYREEVDEEFIYEHVFILERE